MKILPMLLMILLMAGCNRSKQSTPTSGETQILVTESHLELLKDEATEFSRSYEAVRIHLAATTTREAIVHFLNDSVQCICIDRELNPEEQNVADNAGIKITVNKIAIDALVVVVHESNSLQSISMERLKEILSGRITRWHQVPGSSVSGALEFVLTGKNSGMYELLQRKFFRLSQELVPAKAGATQEEIVRYVAATPQALGIVSLAALRNRPKEIRLLAIETMDSTLQKQNVEASQTNIYRSLYPMNYSLYLYVSEKRQAVGSGFSTFVLTTIGQKIVQNYGLVPERIPNRIIQLTSE
jgi:phosphate transport system substrate-binding protein